jgi:hypothetical protein
MRDLDEIIDFDSASDNRLTERRAVDRSVGADLDVIFNYDNARLGDLDARAPGARIAESIAADHDSGMENNPVADAASFAHDNVRVKYARITHLDFVAEKNTGIEDRVLTDLDAASNEYVRENRDATSHNGAIIDIGARADFTLKMRSGLKQLEDFRESNVWVDGF